MLNTITQAEKPQAIHAHKSEPCAHLLQVSELLHFLLEKRERTYPNKTDTCDV